jgi:hypothetical protein
MALLCVGDISSPAEPFTHNNKLSLHKSHYLRLQSERPYGALCEVASPAPSRSALPLPNPTIFQHH